jgi:DNA polymerase-3 subunit alpha
MDRLSREFEAVGFYLSGHPMDEYATALKRLGAETHASFLTKIRSQGATAARLAATVTHRNEKRSKQCNPYAFVGFSDPTGQFETVCFGDLLRNARDLLEPGRSVLLRVEAEVDGEEIKLKLQGVDALDKAVTQVQQGLHVFVRGPEPVESIAKRLERGGRAPVLLTLISDTGREIDVSLGENFRVTPQIRGALKAALGVVDVQDL